MLTNFWATMSTRYTAEPESYDSPTNSPTESTSKPLASPPKIQRRMSAHAQADADRAMQHTNNWTPVFERRHSWNKEDQKHALHMSACCIDSVKTGPGFSERKSST